MSDNSSTAGVESLLRSLQEEPGFAVLRVDPKEEFLPRVAVLPSAFNPPTRAHLHLLDVARSVEDIGMAAALLSTRNVDKGLYGAAIHHRVGMLLSLHQKRPDIAVLASNAARIIDQAVSLRVDNPGVGFDFIVGFDTLVRVFDPRYYGEGDHAPNDSERLKAMAAELEPFFNDHRLIATNRGDESLDDLYRYLETPIVRDFGERIVLREIDSEPARLSSTQQRKAIEEGDDPDGLAPGVREYIDRQRLYRENDD
jgi:nicotinic acid mononucleotide adenylyltransferase